MLKLKLFNHKTGELLETLLTPESMTHNEFLIGRANSCNLVLDSSEVSRVHGRIKLQNKEYCYSDLGSANGSRLNNQAIQLNQNYSLKVDDLIRIGDFVLMVEAVETLAENSEVSIWQKLNSDRSIWADDLKLRCIRIIHETADVKTFTFVAEPAILFQYQPGQFVTLNLIINHEPISRSYSISSSPSRPHTLEITVKRVAAPPDAPDAPAGLVSNWLHDCLKVGDTIEASKPLGKFTCAPHPAEKLLLISAGSGITPMMSMSRWITDTASTTDIIFFHSARTPNDIIYRQEIELMATRLPNFHPAIALTRPELGQSWLGFTGRLTPVLLQMIAPDFQNRTVYVCGPAGFMQATKTLLEGLGFPMQNYYEESFGAPKPKAVAPAANSSTAANSPAVAASPAANSPAVAEPAQSASSQPIVYFTESQAEASATHVESILEAAEQVGVKIRSGCRQGVCGACKKRKLEGEIRYETEPDGLDPADREADYILPCVAVAIGRVLIEA